LYYFFEKSSQYDKHLFTELKNDLGRKRFKDTGEVEKAVRLWLITKDISMSLYPYPQPDQTSLRPLPAALKSILILSSHLCLGLASDILSSGFPTKPMYTPILSPISATCPAHLSLHYFTRIICGEEFRV
jgi:hypothetical protein